MSSEMRELLAEMRTEMETNLTGFGIYPKIRAMCDKIEALLARTEAGADGVGQSGAFKMTMRMAEMHAAAILLLRKLDEVHKDPKYMAVWEIAQNHIGPYRGPQYTAELARLRAATVPFEEYTHPQDASGDAVTGRVNGYMFSARAIEIITDGEVPEWITKTPGLRVTITAMQAKEAK